MSYQNNKQKPDDSSVSTAIIGQEIVNAGILAEVLKKQLSTPQTTSLSITQPTSFESIKAEIVKSLSSKYPIIVINNDVLGEPILNGTRMPVSTLLTAISLYGKFDEVREEFDDRYSDEQLKQAIKYARDVLDSVFTS